MSVPPPPPPNSPPPPPGSSDMPAPPMATPSTPSAPGVPPMTPMSNLGKRRSTGLVIVLTIVTFGIWAVVWSYQTGDEFQRNHGRGAGGVAYLFITLFISPVTMFLMANEVEQRYRERGWEPPITTIWGLWFLLPLIGNIIWYVRIQRAINEYWTALGQTNEPGL